MGKYSFIQVSPEEIQSDPKAMEYLQRGADGFGGMVSVERTLQNYLIGRDIYVIGKLRNNLACSIYLTVTHQETGKVLTSVLLGGDNFGDWAEELKDFYYKLAREHDCDEFMLMGRKGFKRYFSELSEVATVFRVILKEPLKTIN